MLNNFDRVLALLNCCRVLLFFKYSLLYIEVWNERFKCQHIQKESLLKLDLSPMILCLIKVLSYEGSISNPFQLWRNIVVGVVVFQSCYLVLYQRHKTEWWRRWLYSSYKVQCQCSLYFTTQMSLNPFEMTVALFH